MEDGSDESCALTGSCPLRQCVDEHVTKIYNGFLPIPSQLVDKGFPKSRAVEVLETLKEILINLKKSPFQTRRVSIDSIPNVNQSVVRQLLPSFTESLSALSLSSKVDSDGRVEISLAGHAVKTSLALPVTFHALDVTIRNLKGCVNFVKDSLCSPLLKLNRIHSGQSGVVRASGEEIPFGIVSVIVFCSFTSLILNLRNLHIISLINFRSHQLLMGHACPSGTNQLVQKVSGSCIKYQITRCTNLWHMSLCRPMMHLKEIQWIGSSREAMMGVQAGIY